jgi:triacylglycerol esterase/lipase EstA (alpha/beta hydrolase family)
VPARPSLRDTSVWAREAVGRAAVLALAPLDLAWRLHPPPGATALTPVLIVADPTLPRGAVRYLVAFLRTRGREVAVARLPRRGSSALGELAEALVGEVESLARETGAEAVDLVGHGVGGVVAAWYLSRLDGSARCRRLVTIASPWAGTRVAAFGRHRVSSDMLYGSPSLVGLAPTVPTVAIWSADDPFVVPSESAAPAGALRVRVDAAGHVDMLLSPRVYRAVLVALTEPLAAAPGGEA